MASTEDTSCLLQEADASVPITKDRPAVKERLANHSDHLDDVTRLVSRNKSWLDGTRAYFIGHGDGKARQDYSLPVAVDAYPKIGTESSKYYGVWVAEKSLAYAESEEFEKSVEIERGVCALCRGIFADDEGKRGFKIFPWHGDVFRMVKSSRLGCRICRLLGQTVREHGDGGQFGWMGGSSNWICVCLEDWEGVGREKRRRCYVTRTMQGMPSLWKFDVVWIYPLGNGNGNASIQPLKANDEMFIQDSWLNSCPLLPKNSREVLGLTKSWLEDCEGCHKLCNTKTKSGWRPTRLLNVADGMVELEIQPDSKVSARYATLSHCWGKLNVIQLQMNNISQFLDEIPEATLSQTFCQAVEILDFLVFNGCG